MDCVYDECLHQVAGAVFLDAAAVARIPILEDSKRLFFFVLDLFILGALLKFGFCEDEEVNITITSLTTDQFAVIDRCLQKIGIRCVLNTEGEPSGASEVNFHQLMCMSDAGRLEDYVLEATASHVKYTLFFSFCYPSQACKDPPAWTA